MNLTYRSALSKKQALTLTGIYLLVCMLFKFLYPYPDLFGDSINYIEWGIMKMPLAYRPLGYTHFLMWFNGMGANYITIIVLQLLAYLVACLYFLSTVLLLLPDNKYYRNILTLFILFNPVSLFLNNMMAADGLFMSFSIIWLASIIRIAMKEKMHFHFAIHLVAFYVLYNLRYNALYYPLFTVILVFFMKEKTSIKLVYAAIVIIFGTALYQNTLDHSERWIGVRMLSGFQGWAMANNAIHIYKVQEVDPDLWDTPQEQGLHAFIMKYKDSIDIPKTQALTDAYQWSNKGPLKRFMVNIMIQANSRHSIYYWWGLAKFYNGVGWKLVLTYPGAFMKAFYLPNLANCIYPPSETMAGYTAHTYTLSEPTRAFLGTGNKKLITKAPMLQVYTVRIFGYVYAVLTVVTMVVSVFFMGLWCLRFRKSNQPDLLRQTLVLFTGFYIISILLSALAHIVHMRYIALLMILMDVAIPLLFFAWYKENMGKKSAA